MRVLGLRVIVGVAVAVVSSVCARGQVQVGASIDEEGVQGFYLAIGEYFGQPEREVSVVRERGLPDEEVPVVYLVAARARVAPGVIIDLRLGGMKWMDICARYALSPEIFYVPAGVEVQGPPYGKAYGYYKKKPREQWHTIVLADNDVVNLVNLKVMSEYHRIPATDIIKTRSGGKSFVVINDDLSKGHKEKTQKEKGKKKSK